MADDTTTPDPPKPPPAGKPLGYISPKQDQFCRQYVVDFNGTQAAIRAGYSPKTAGVQASVLLAQPKIQERVKELRRSLDSVGILSATETMEEISRIAAMSITDFMEITPSGVAKVKELGMLPPGYGRAIRKIKQRIVQVGKKMTVYTEIELWSKDHALSLLQQYHRPGPGNEPPPAGNTDEQLARIAAALEAAHGGT